MFFFVFFDIYLYICDIFHISDKYMIKDYFSFFLDNKSGWKTNAKSLSKKEPELYSEIIKFVEINSLSQLSFLQQVWHFLHKYTEIPKCLECEKTLSFKRSLREGYGKYCSISCTNKNSNHINESKKTWKSKETQIVKKIKKTIFEKYGVENIFQDKEKIKKGFKEKYGVDNVWEIEGINEKRKKTFFNKYKLKSNLDNEKVREISILTKQNKFLSKYSNLNFKNFVGNDLIIECDLCNSVYEINRSLLRHRVLYSKIPCTICNPKNSGDSFFEKELVYFIKSFYNDTIIENDRTLIHPKELDVLLPNSNLAIEFNGLFWHSSEFVENNYHLNKSKICKNNGIDLIHIYEDEWVYKKDIVKSILKTKLHVYETILYGRKCQVKEIDSRLYKTFCINNHIQGHINASIKLGLFYGDELVSIMSFGNLRKSLGSKKEEGTYEMLRFCTKLNTKVIGGASKLFSHFVKKYTPNKIISFSDKRYFDGNLYLNMGFEFVKDTTPNYFYITDYLKRENRFKFRKNVLVKEGYDVNKSESQIMKERGIPKIYDCGNKKWVWKS